MQFVNLFQISAITVLMQWANDQPEPALSRELYRSLRMGLMELVFVQFGKEITDRAFELVNWGGNGSWLVDIHEAVVEALAEAEEAEADAASEAGAS